MLSYKSQQVARWCVEGLSSCLERGDPYLEGVVSRALRKFVLKMASFSKSKYLGSGGGGECCWFVWLSILRHTCKSNLVFRIYHKYPCIMRTHI